MTSEISREKVVRGIVGKYLTEKIVIDLARAIGIYFRRQAHFASVSAMTYAKVHPSFAGFLHKFLMHEKFLELIKITIENRVKLLLQ